MSLLDLSTDEVLATTRAVRKRLDLSRPVEPEVIWECLQGALQAPTASNSQGWHFVVVTDRQQRQALAEIYRKGLAVYRERVMSGAFTAMLTPERGPSREVAQRKVGESSAYLAEHLHEVPVLIVPCLWGRAEGLPSAEQAGFWGSIMPAVWSFMLAARARGLGTSFTTVHLFYEQEAAQVLGIPYAQVTQAALIPMAYTLGTAFKPAPREPLENVMHWDRW